MLDFRGGALGGSSCLMYNPVPYIPSSVGSAGDRRRGLVFTHDFLRRDRPVASGSLGGSSTGVLLKGAGGQPGAPGN